MAEANHTARDLAWKISYSNDTGPDDEGFWEWWEVSDGKRTFKCDEQQDAEWLCDLLNASDGAQ